MNLRRTFLRSRNTGFYFVISVLSVSCYNDGSNIKNHSLDSMSVVDTVCTVDEDSANVIWEYDMASDSLIKRITPNDISYQVVLKQFNMRYPLINVAFVKLSDDTIFVKIEDASYLTQRMGSAGAYAFMSEFVYSLTEVPTIHFVDIDFQEGDHASPGMYSREDFKNKL